MNGKVTLSVYKNSPHIWAGGLEGEDLARWLIGKANAIRWLISQQKKAANHQQCLTELRMAESLIKSYAALGLSQKECDPILPLSREAIQFDMEACESASVHKRCVEGTEFPPVGYSLLPDLAGVRAEPHRMKDLISAQASTQCGKAENE